MSCSCCNNVCRLLPPHKRTSLAQPPSCNIVAWLPLLGDTAVRGCHGDATTLRGYHCLAMLPAVHSPAMHCRTNRRAPWPYITESSLHLAHLRAMVPGTMSFLPASSLSSKAPMQTQACAKVYQQYDPSRRRDGDKIRRVDATHCMSVTKPVPKSVCNTIRRVVSMLYEKTFRTHLTY